MGCWLGFSVSAVVGCHGFWCWQGGWRPVCRVWPILTRSWVGLKSLTSGAGALKLHKNCKVQHYTMAPLYKHKTSKSEGHPGAYSWSI